MRVNEWLVRLRSESAVDTEGGPEGINRQADLQSSHPSQILRVVKNGDFFFYLQVLIGVRVQMFKNG